METTVVCPDGRTLRRMTHDGPLFKYYVEEMNDCFTSSLASPTAAYRLHLKWINTYFTPDGCTVQRLVTSGQYNKYILKETGEIFYSFHRNIYEAYMDEWLLDEASEDEEERDEEEPMDLDDSGISV